jgi:hypothetical protein
MGGTEQSALVVWVSAGLLVVGWTALLVAPVAHRQCWFAARTCAMLLALIWAMLTVTAFGAAIPGQLWGSGWPAAMQQSQSVGQAALVQFQAFNLFVASWQVEDSPRHEIPHAWLLPGLVTTALAGPFGLMIHMAIRDIFKLRQKRRAEHARPD